MSFLKKKAAKKPFYLSGVMFLLAPILFACCYAAFFVMQKETADNAFEALIQDTPSIRMFGSNAVERVRSLIIPYGVYTGGVLLLPLILLSLVAGLVLRIFGLRKFNLFLPLALLVGVAPLAFFGWNMVFESARFTALSGGIILYLGYPLWHASLAYCGFLGLMLLIALVGKQHGKTLMITFFLASSVFLSGCDILNELLGSSCDFNPDSVHCFQEAAVGSGDPDQCEKVGEKAEFRGSGSNPPKDKCFFMVAVNQGDPTVCDRIQGGMMSYSKEECIQETIKAGGLASCEQSPQKERCKQLYGTPTGTCPENETFDKGSEKCVPSAIDPECADPTFTSKCFSSDSLLSCAGGKKSITSCEFGCFEAACRTEAGPTDISPTPEPSPTGEPSPSANPSDSPEPDACNCLASEECIEGVCFPKGCERDAECAQGEICYYGICYDNGCKADSDCLDTEKCLQSLCTPKTAECVYAADCKDGNICEQDKCVPAPACDVKKDAACISSTLLESCVDGKMTSKTCDNGCDNKHCLSTEEKEKADKEKEKEAACKAGYNKCISDTTLENCTDGKKTETMCEFGCKSGACKEDDSKCTGWQAWNPLCKEADDDIEDKLKDDLNTIGDAAGGKYMELLDDEIEKTVDPAKLEGLKKYKEFLEQAGETMEGVQTTVDGLKNIKRIFLDSYSPAMDIENMPVDKLLKPGLFDRIGTSIFGGPKTDAGKELAEAEDALTVYEAMLERQGEIDFLKKSRMERLGDTISEGVKDKAFEEAGEYATDLAGAIAGDAMIAVAPIDYALSAFQDEAKKQAFAGLARAYNRRRAELEAQHPDMDNENIHKLVIQQVQDDPYLDAKGPTFIKYGNILENKDCQEGTGNPLCVDRKVWWTAMEKTYEYTHSHELTQRTINQFDRAAGK